MNLRHTLTAAAALLLAATVHAHDCSGGADGGMDATGNLCSEPAPAVAAAPAAAPATDVRPARPVTARAARTAARAPNGPQRVARAATAQGR